MELLFEILFSVGQLLCELVLQLIFEALAELGIGAVKQAVRSSRAAPAGWAMVELGRWRQRRGRPPIMLHRFLYGYLFALSFAAVRLGCTL